MSTEEFPVYVPVARPDGSTERVRVGSAVRSGDGFLLSLGEVFIGGTAAPRASAAPPTYSQPPQGSEGGGPVFPNYGRSKNQPIYGATETDLDYYANGCRRTLGDEGKARWHDKERVLLAAIEAEVARQRGGGAPSSSGGAQGTSGGHSNAPSGPPSGRFGGREDGPPPPTDDDIPF